MIAEFLLWCLESWYRLKVKLPSILLQRVNKPAKIRSRNIKKKIKKKKKKETSKNFPDSELNYAGDLASFWISYIAWLKSCCNYYEDLVKITGIFIFIRYILRFHGVLAMTA